MGGGLLERGGLIDGPGLFNSAKYQYVSHS